MTRKSVSTINIESLVAKENNYSNPYVAISSTMASNLGASIINIIDFISENTKEDINENFFYRTSSFDYGQEVIAQGNLFSILSEADFNSYVDWDTGFPQKLFNKLYDLGAIFSNGTKNYVFPNRDALSTVSDIKTGTSDIRKTNKIFENVHNEKKAICLLGFAYKQMSQENFTNEVQKAKTLHQAVQFNNINLIKFLIEDCKISPNLKDEKNLTPIFSARRLESLELLSKYETDWFHLNAEGKDCLSVYISSSIDKSISVKMVDFVQKQMKMSIKHGEKSDLGENYIEERIKLNLLDMVTSDKTKKDLQDFIKKNEIKDISKIADEKGNNLAIICLKNQNWARYNMFKDDCGIDSENNFGTSPLEIMLSKKYIKRENDATKVLDELFSKKVYKKNIKFSFNMIKRAIYKNENISLPTWYFRSSNKSQIIKLFKDIAEGNYDLIDDFYKRCE